MNVYKKIIITTFNLPFYILNSNIQYSYKPAMALLIADCKALFGLLIVSSRILEE